MTTKLTARLACGCRVGFHDAKPGVPVTAFIERKFGIVISPDSWA